MIDLGSLHLVDALTATGAAAFAVLITSIIALLKNVRGLGPWLDAGNEPAIVYLLAAAAVIGAIASVGLATVDGNVILTGIVSWIGISQLAMVVHDKGPAITDKVLVTAPGPAT